jgi:glutamate synthase (NADPH/NADH) small chain
MTEGCPVHNHIPEFIAMITEGDFEGAYQVLAQTTSLPAVCGRVCPQYLQCEGNCVRGRSGQPVAIGALERFVADWHRTHYAEENVSEKVSDQNTDKKIAVIGSGPAGLACAGDLLDLGYQVTIYEKEDVLGGVLAYGIPEFRLPGEILEREIETLSAKGMKTECGRKLGSDFTIEELLNKDGYDAVFLANGAGKPINLDIPGRDASGVITAAEFLEKANLENSLPEGKQIVIVGGGNVAMDACRCAIRIASAEKVTIVYRRSQAEMPADPAELTEAMDEGVEILYLTGPVAVESMDGSVTGLRCQKMQLSEPDASGRKSVVPVSDSEFILPADLIIEAIGSRSDNACTDGVNLSEQKGYVIVDPDTCKTSLKGVFAGGDTVTGPKTVISAMGAGKKAARAIDEYLRS